MADRGRRGGGVSGFWQNVSDDLKEFFDDEVVDRVRNVERDLRRDRDKPAEAESGRRAEMDELRAAIAELSKKVSALTDRNKSTGNGPADRG